MKQHKEEKGKGESTCNCAERDLVPTGSAPAEEVSYEPMDGGEDSQSKATQKKVKHGSCQQVY